MAQNLQDHGNPMLEASGICKHFGKNQVLKEVDFTIRPGEVHALIGENGAGKSTLLKIFFGIHRQSSGTLHVDGNPVTFQCPGDAIRCGIAMIHQEPLVFQDLNIMENLFMGYLGSSIINWRALEETADGVMEAIGLSAPLDQKMARLSVAEQQLVEIGAALVSNAKIIFMDEPTASLTPHEVDNLLRIIGQLREEGRSIVYISHRLEEIRRIADRVTVLRDGGLVGTFQNDGLTQDDMIRYMLGHELALKRSRRQRDFSGPPYFEAKGIGIPGIFEDVSFQVRKGEILGIAGLMGSGRTEVARGLFGITPIRQGGILVDGKPARIESPEDAIRSGIALVPEDRQLLGLFLNQSIALNTTFAIMERITGRWGWLKREREQELAQEYNKTFTTKFSSVHQAVGELSGGNQQKVSLAKWIATDPDVLILDEPTRGIDIGAKEEVYGIIEALSAQGKCIIMISSELSEILALSDRVLVMYEGRPTATIPTEELCEMKILSAAHNYAD